jgi:hypothetical protein
MTGLKWYKLSEDRDIVHPALLAYATIQEHRKLNMFKGSEGMKGTEHPTGYDYLIYELLPGNTLSEIRKRADTFSEAKEWAEKQVAEWRNAGVIKTFRIHFHGMHRGEFHG